MEPLSWRRAGAPARNRAVFVDRDGVLNRWIRGGFVLRREDVVFNEASIRALAGIDRERFALVVISNQRWGGRGLPDAESPRVIMAPWVQGAAARGLDIDAWYCCIHAPDAGCACRKPAPGLLSQAGADFGFDPARSYFIGDPASDIEAASRAGVLGLPVRPDAAADVRVQLARIAKETRHVG